MKRLNIKIIAGILINAVITLLAQLSRDYAGFEIIMWVIIAINLIGIILILCNVFRIGAWTIIISSVFFVPIGIIGLLGGRQVLTKLEQEEIDED